MQTDWQEHEYPWQPHSVSHEHSAQSDWQPHEYPWQVHSVSHEHSESQLQFAGQWPDSQLHVCESHWHCADKLAWSVDNSVVFIVEVLIFCLKLFLSDVNISGTPPLCVVILL